MGIAGDLFLDVHYWSIIVAILCVIFLMLIYIIWAFLKLFAGEISEGQ